MARRKGRRKKDPLKAYILRKKIFALLFLTSVFGYAGVNAWYGGDIWLETVEESLAGGIELATAPQTISDTVSALDALGLQIWPDYTVLGMRPQKLT